MNLVVPCRFPPFEDGMVCGVLFIDFDVQVVRALAKSRVACRLRM